MESTTIRHYPDITPASLTIPMAKQRHPAVGRNRIYAAIESGSLTGIRVGKRFAIPVDELDSWVRAGCPIGEPSRKTGQR